MNYFFYTFIENNRMDQWNKIIVKGDTFKGAQFEMLVNGVSKNLTGAAIKVQFREKTKTGIVKKTIEIGSGITVTNAVNGLFTINPFIVDFNVGKNFYDVQIIDAGGVVKTYVEGYFEVLQDVTV